MDGYQIQISSDNGKTYSKKKTIKKGTTYKWAYRSGKDGKTYIFRIRGYKKFSQSGKKYYTNWNYSEPLTFKKK